MNSEGYQLVTAVAGSFTTGMFTLLSTIVTLRGKSQRVATASKQRIVGERVKQRKSKSPAPSGRFPKMLIFLIVVGLGAGIGFFFGSATKKSPPVVKLYNRNEQIAISRERIREINNQIKIAEQQKQKILLHSTVLDAKKRAAVERYDAKRDLLKDKKEEFKRIIRE
jgi:hypothetical protein